MLNELKFLNPAKSVEIPKQVQKAAKNALRSLRRQGICPEASLENPWMETSETYFSGTKC